MVVPAPFMVKGVGFGHQGQGQGQGQGRGQGQGQGQGLGCRVAPVTASIGVADSYVMLGTWCGVWVVGFHQQPKVNYLPRFGPQLISLEE